MSNIKHVKSSKFLLKTNNYLSKSYIFNTKYINYKSYYFKLFNICKFACDKKTLIRNHILTMN